MAGPKKPMLLNLADGVSEADFHEITEEEYNAILEEQVNEVM